MILPLAFQRNENPCVAIALTGLLRGHSGIMINQGRQNADKMLGAFLASLPSFELVSISGGFKDNVIPNAAECVIATSLSVDEISAHAADFVRKNRLDTDSGLSLRVSARTVFKVPALTASRRTKQLNFLPLCRLACKP